MTGNINLNYFQPAIIQEVILKQPTLTKEAFRAACLEGKLDTLRGFLDTLSKEECSDYLNQANAAGEFTGEEAPLICEISLKWAQAIGQPEEQEVWKQILELFLANGALADSIIPGNSATVFLGACSVGSQELASLFLQYGANPNHISDEGSAYHVIVEHIEDIDLAKEMIQFALENKCDPNLKNRKGISASVLTAADPNKIELTKLLMEYANTDLLLHNASYSGNLPLMKYLIDKDPFLLEVSDGYGTPLDWAYKRANNKEAVRYLSEDLVKKESPSWAQSAYSTLSFWKSMFFGYSGCHEICGFFTTFAMRARPFHKDDLDLPPWRKAALLLLGSPISTVGHELGHAFACKLLTGQDSCIYIHPIIGGSTYRKATDSEWRSNAISASGPLFSMSIQIATLALVRILKNYISRPVAGILGGRAAFWMFDELHNACSSTIKKDDNDFGKIAKTNTKHFAVAFFILLAQGVVGSYQVMKLFK